MEKIKREMFTCLLVMFVAELVMLGGGCQSDPMDYIEDQATAKIKYGDNYRIIMFVEDRDDLNTDIVPDLLWAQEHIAETILPDAKALKRVVVFIAATEESYDGICPSGTFGCIQMFDMVEGNIIISYSPRGWRESPRNIVETFVHELTHYISYKIDGSGDGPHTREEYWGKNGIIAIVLKEWKERARDFDGKFHR